MCNLVKVCESGCCDSVSQWKSGTKDLAVSHCGCCVRGSVEVKQFLGVFWLPVSIFDVLTSSWRWQEEGRHLKCVLHFYFLQVSLQPAETVVKSVMQAVSVCFCFALACKPAPVTKIAVWKLITSTGCSQAQDAAYQTWGRTGCLRLCSCCVQWTKWTSCDKDVVSALTVLSVTGDMGVGKSCLLHQFTEKKCEYKFTIFIQTGVLCPSFLPFCFCHAWAWCIVFLNLGLFLTIWLYATCSDLFVSDSCKYGTKCWCSNSKSAASVLTEWWEDCVHFHSSSRELWYETKWDLLSKMCLYLILI